MATKQRGAKAPPAKTGEEDADRRFYAAAVLSGIYAATGLAILSAENNQYSLALKNARRVAFDQADEMLRYRGKKS